MTQVERAAFRLIRHLRRNICPEDAEIGREEEWPIHIDFVYERDRERLEKLMLSLEMELEIAGHSIYSSKK